MYHPRRESGEVVCDEDLTVCLYAGGRTNDAAGLNEVKRRELCPNMKGWLQTELCIVLSRGKDRL